jgi:hypothetical protein
VVPSFRDILTLKYEATVSDTGEVIPERSKSFEECLVEAARVIGLRQDVFVRRSTFFMMKREENEGQSAYIRRCKETARRANLPAMSVSDHAMHSYLSGCGAKIRDFIILNSRNMQPTLAQVKDSINNPKYTWTRWNGSLGQGRKET